MNQNESPINPAVRTGVDSGGPPGFRVGSDLPFLTIMIGLGGTYLLLISAMLLADILYTSPLHFRDALAKPEIQYAIRLTLISCTVSALLSVWVATPLGYLLSRVLNRYLNPLRLRWLAIGVSATGAVVLIGRELLLAF